MVDHSTIVMLGAGPWCWRLLHRRSLPWRMWNMSHQFSRIRSL